MPIISWSSLWTQYKCYGQSVESHPQFFWPSPASLYPQLLPNTTFCLLLACLPLCNWMWINTQTHTHNHKHSDLSDLKCIPTSQPQVGPSKDPAILVHFPSHFALHATEQFYTLLRENLNTSSLPFRSLLNCHLPDDDSLMHLELWSHPSPRIHPPSLAQYFPQHSLHLTCHIMCLFCRHVVCHL